MAFEKNECALQTGVGGREQGYQAGRIRWRVNQFPAAQTDAGALAPAKTWQYWFQAVSFVMGFGLKNKDVLRLLPGQISHATSPISTVLAGGWAGIFS
jgi:hypothetical protein